MNLSPTIQKRVDTDRPSHGRPSHSSRPNKGAVHFRERRLPGVINAERALYWGFVPALYVLLKTDGTRDQRSARRVPLSQEAGGSRAIHTKDRTLVKTI